MHRAALLLDLGLSMPSPPSRERARPGCMQKNGYLMPGCLTRTTEAWMPERKRRPGCMQKKRRPGRLTKNGCIQQKRIIPVVYRVMCLGTWRLQWAKGLLGPLGKIQKIKNICSLGPLGGCNGQRGGEGGMSTPGMQKHTHMLSQGVVVATSHTANIHNLSIPSYVIQVLQTWAVS